MLQLANVVAMDRSVVVVGNRRLTKNRIVMLKTADVVLCIVDELTLSNDLGGLGGIEIGEAEEGLFVAADSGGVGGGSIGEVGDGSFEVLDSDLDVSAMC